MVTGLAAVHAALYMAFYVRKGVLRKRVGEGDVLFGLVAGMGLVLLAAGVVVGRRRRRRRKGKGWVAMHGCAAAVVGAALWGHVLQARVYVVQATVLGVVGLAWRVGRKWRRRRRSRVGKVEM